MNTNKFNKLLQPKHEVESTQTQSDEVTNSQNTSDYSNFKINTQKKETVKVKSIGMTSDEVTSHQTVKIIDNEILIKESNEVIMSQKTPAELIAHEVKSYQEMIDNSKIYTYTFRYNGEIKTRVEKLKEDMESEGTTFSMNKYLLNLLNKDLKNRGL